MTVTEVNSTTINGTTTSSNITKNKIKITTSKEELIKEEEEITLEDLAPDGGWGWMIALAMILIMFTTLGPASSFGITFGNFLEESGKAATASSFSKSVFIINFSISSLLTNILLKRYSTRSVGIMSAFLFAISDITLAFVRNIYDMAFIYFIQGFGFGLIVTVTNTVFNSYFVKKRAKVMYASQVIIALGGIIYPMLCEKMLPLYGFRGTAAIVGALSLNSIVGMTMMHPMKWHAKKLEKVRAEKAREKEQKIFRELTLSNGRSTINPLFFKTKWSNLRNLKKERGTEMSLLNKTLKPSAQRIASVSAMESHEKAKSVEENLSRSTSASSLVNLTTRTTCMLNDIQQLHLKKRNYERQIHEEIQEKEEKKNTEKRQKMTKYKTFLRELVDMSLVKNCCFMNLCFGVDFVRIADLGFSSLLPLIMIDMGYSIDDAALGVTISGIAELASKILLSIFTLIVNVKSKYIFFVATIFMGFAKISFLLYGHTLTDALITIAVIGAVRSWLLVPQPLVIIEDLNIEKFASAYGINSVITCVVTITFGAIVGIIKDWTGSYKIYQISLLVLNGVFILPWTLQFILVDFKKWRKQRAQETNTKSTDHEWE